MKSIWHFLRSSSPFRNKSESDRRSPHFHHRNKHRKDSSNNNNNNSANAITNSSISANINATSINNNNGRSSLVSEHQHTHELSQCSDRLQGQQYCNETFVKSTKNSTSASPSSSSSTRVRSSLPGSKGLISSSSKNSKFLLDDRFTEQQPPQRRSVGNCFTRSSGERGSSIPESVLIGLIPNIGGISKKQRNSAPTIIHKDKAEKAWERMLKMKSNEKKSKRKKSRMMFKNWRQNSPAHNQNSVSPNCDYRNAPYRQDSKTYDDGLEFLEPDSVEYFNGRHEKRLSISGKMANVVVIIDKVSPIAAHDTELMLLQELQDRHLVQSDDHKRQESVSTPNSTTPNSPNTLDDVPETDYDPTPLNQEFSFPIQKRRSSLSISSAPNQDAVRSPETTNPHTPSGSQRRLSKSETYSAFKNTDYNPEEGDGSASQCGLPMPETSPTDGSQPVNNNGCIVRDTSSGGGTPVHNTSATFLASESMMEHQDQQQHQREIYRDNSTDSRSYGDGDSVRIEPDDDVLEVSSAGRGSGTVCSFGATGNKAPESYSDRIAKRWIKPESCSSYSSLNNDSLSLQSPDAASAISGGDAGSGGLGSGLCAGNSSIGIGERSSDLGSTSPFDFHSGIASGGPVSGGCGIGGPGSGSIGGSFNFPRKYSLTVPGEPRHFRTLHRRESGSRSPLNSSCGGLSHSELSTPSPSISNSINDDQSSCSSTALNAISIELNRKCTLSVDSLLLQSNRVRKSLSSEERDRNELSAGNHDDDEEEEDEDEEEDEEEEHNGYELEQYADYDEFDDDDLEGEDDDSFGNTYNNKSQCRHRRPEVLSKTITTKFALTKALCGLTTNARPTPSEMKLLHDSYIDHLKRSNKDKDSDNDGNSSAPLTPDILSYSGDETIIKNLGTESKMDSGSTADAGMKPKNDSESKSGGSKIDKTTKSKSKSNKKNNKNKNNKDDDSHDGDDHSPKGPRKRKDSVTAIIASFLLPESLANRIGGSLSTDPIHQSGTVSPTSNSDAQIRSSQHNQKSSRGLLSRSLFSKAFSHKEHSTSETEVCPRHHRRHRHRSHHHRAHCRLSSTGDDPLNDSPSSPQPNPGASGGRRKGSIAQITSVSADKIAKLLRRTHSAGCSKDAPSHALFLKNDPAQIIAKKRKEKKRGRKQAPALQDMKQRLRFLNRRHTDSSLHQSTVRPSQDEIEKWSKSFRDLMANRYGSALFRAFLAREYSEENIEFWIACEDYRKARSSKMPHKARKIFDNFVAVRSPKEVNLENGLRSQIEKSLSTVSKTMFDDAQKKIQILLENDSYIRFLQSDLYIDLARSEAERQMYERSIQGLSANSGSASGSGGQIPGSGSTTGLNLENSNISNNSHSNNANNKHHDSSNPTSPAPNSATLSSMRMMTNPFVYDSDTTIQSRNSNNSNNSAINNANNSASNSTHNLNSAVGAAINAATAAATSVTAVATTANKAPKNSTAVFLRSDSRNSNS